MKFSSAHLAAALASILVGYGSGAVITYQAALAFAATPLQIASWFTAIAVCGEALTL